MRAFILKVSEIIYIKGEMSYISLVSEMCRYRKTVEYEKGDMGECKLIRCRKIHD